MWVLAILLTALIGLNIGFSNIFDYNNNNSVSVAVADGTYKVTIIESFDHWRTYLGENTEGNVIKIDSDLIFDLKLNTYDFNAFNTNSDTQGRKVGVEFTDKTIDFQGHEVIVRSSGMLNSIVTIQNLRFGIFESLTNCTVKNLRLSVRDISSLHYSPKGNILASEIVKYDNEAYFGFLCAYAKNCTFDNIELDLIISKADFEITQSSRSKEVYFGGLVGVSSGCKYSNIVMNGGVAFNVANSVSFSYTSIFGGLVGTVRSRDVDKPDSFENIAQYASIEYSYISSSNASRSKIYGVFGQELASNTTKVENVLFSNGGKANSLLPYMGGSNCVEVKTTADVVYVDENDKETTRTYNLASLSYSTAGRAGMVRDMEEFNFLVYNIFFAPKYYNYRTLLSSSAFFNSASHDVDFVLLKVDKYNGLPIPATVMSILSPEDCDIEKDNVRDYYYIDSDEDFYNMSIGQSFSTKFRNQDMVLTKDINLLEEHLPFVNYQGSRFNGGNHTLTIPKEINLVSLCASVFALVNNSIIENLNVNMNGTFDAATAVKAFAEKNGGSTKYEEIYKKGAFHHAGFAGKCTSYSEGVTNPNGKKRYEFKNVIIEYTGNLYGDSSYWAGNDYTSARIGALVGEEFHSDTASPLYENCLVVWRDGELLDKAKKVGMNGSYEIIAVNGVIPQGSPAPGVYVRVDIGVFWDGKTQTTNGISETLKSLFCLVKYNALDTFDKVMTGKSGKKNASSLIREEVENGLNYNFNTATDTLSFKLFGSDYSHTILTAQNMSKYNQVDNGAVINATYDNVGGGSDEFYPEADSRYNTYYVYSVIEINISDRLNQVEIESTANKYYWMKGKEFDINDIIEVFSVEGKAEVPPTYDGDTLIVPGTPAVDAIEEVKKVFNYNNENMFFYGFCNIPSESTNYVTTLNQHTTITREFLPIEVENTEGVFNGSAFVPKVKNNYGYDEVVSVDNITNANTYEDVTITVGNRGYVSFDFVVKQKEITVTPYEGQKLQVLNSAGEKIKLKDVNINYFSSDDNLIYNIKFGFVGKVDEDELDTGDYIIQIVSCVLTDEVNYKMVFSEGVKFTITDVLAVITITNNLSGKIYDGTTDITEEIIYSAKNALTGDAIDIGDGICTFSTSSSGVGDQQILLEKTENYEVMFEEFPSYTISRKDLSVTIIRKTTKIYDGNSECDIELSSANINGFIVGESESILKGSLSYSQPENKNVGVYDVTLGTLNADNYNIILNEDSAVDKYEIEQKEIKIIPNENQSWIYSNSEPEFIAYTFTDSDDNAYNLPLGDAFMGSLTVGLLSEDVVSWVDGDRYYANDYYTNPEHNVYYIILGDLTLGDNYSLTLADDRVDYTIEPKLISDIIFSEIKQLQFTPCSYVLDVVSSRIIGLEEQDAIITGAVKPSYTIDKYDVNADDYTINVVGAGADNIWGTSDDISDKPGVGFYRAVTNGTFNNKNYVLAEDKVFTVFYEIQPYKLNKYVDFDFEDVEIEFSGDPIIVDSGGIKKNETADGYTYDYPGVTFNNSRFANTNSQDEGGLDSNTGRPLQAGNYQQFSTFLYSSNYTSEFNAGSGELGTIELSRNITILRKVVDFRVWFDDVRYIEKADGDKDEDESDFYSTYTGSYVFIEHLAVGALSQNSINIDLVITYLSKNGENQKNILNVGLYKLVFTIDANDGYYYRNYRMTDNLDNEDQYIIYYEVTKATPNVSATGTSIVYEQSLVDSTLTGVAKNASNSKLKGSWIFVNPSIVPEVGETGRYKATVLFTPSNDYEDSSNLIRYSDNYFSTTCEAIIEVKARTVNIIPEENSTQEYNFGLLDTIEFSTADISDSTRYKFFGSLSAVRTDGKELGKEGYVVNKDGYSIILNDLVIMEKDEESTAIDIAGYKTTNNYVVKLAVGYKHYVVKKQVSVIYKNFEDLVYNDKEGETFACAIDIDASMDSTLNAIKLKTQFKMQDKDHIMQIIDNPLTEEGCNMLHAGYYEVYVYTEDDNFVVDGKVDNISFLVDQMELKKDIITFKTTEFSYSGKVEKLEVVTETLPESFKITYINNNNIKTGTHKVDVYITSDSNDYKLEGVYLSETESYSFSQDININKKLINTITIKNIDDLIYNGKEHKIEADFEGIRTEDNVTKIYKITQNDVDTKPINAGSYKLSVEISENDFYELSEECVNVVDLEIKKKAITIQADETFIKVYNGQKDALLPMSILRLIGIVNGDEISLNSNFEAEFESETVGFGIPITFIKAQLAGKSSANYYIDIENITLVGNITAKRYENTADNDFLIGVVPVTDSNIPLDATFSAELKKESDYKSHKRDLLKRDEQIYKVFSYDILDSKGERISLSSPIKLSIDMKGSAMKIYKVTESGELEEVVFTQNANYAEFNISDYSTYMITIEKKANNVLAPIFASPLFIIGMVLIVGVIVLFVVLTIRRNKNFTIKKKK